MDIILKEVLLSIQCFGFQRFISNTKCKKTEDRKVMRFILVVAFLMAIHSSASVMIKIDKHSISNTKTAKYLVEKSEYICSEDQNFLNYLKSEITDAMKQTMFNKQPNKIITVHEDPFDLLHPSQHPQHPAGAIWDSEQEMQDHYNQHVTDAIKNFLCWDKLTIFNVPYGRYNITEKYYGPISKNKLIAQIYNENDPKDGICFWIVSNGTQDIAISDLDVKHWKRHLNEWNTAVIKDSINSSELGLLNSGFSFNGDYQTLKEQIEIELGKMEESQIDSNLLKQASVKICKSMAKSYTLQSESVMKKITKLDSKMLKAHIINATSKIPVSNNTHVNGNTLQLAANDAGIVAKHSVSSMKFMSKKRETDTENAVRIPAGILCYNNFSSILTRQEFDQLMKTELGKNMLFMTLVNFNRGKYGVMLDTVLIVSGYFGVVYGVAFANPLIIYNGLMGIAMGWDDFLEEADEMSHNRKR